MGPDPGRTRAQWAWAYGPMGQGPWANGQGPMGPMGQGPWARAHGPMGKGPWAQWARAI